VIGCTRHASDIGWKQWPALRSSRRRDHAASLAVCHACPSSWQSSKLGKPPRWLLHRVRLAQDTALAADQFGRCCESVHRSCAPSGNRSATRAQRTTVAQAPAPAAACLDSRPTARTARYRSIPQLSSSQREPSANHSECSKYVSAVALSWTHLLAPNQAQTTRSGEAEAGHGSIAGWHPQQRNLTLAWVNMPMRRN
jgi:hypothetical protein